MLPFSFLSSAIVTYYSCNYKYIILIILFYKKRVIELAGAVSLISAEE